jgi:betaine-aldehyde dehydrogenase
MPPSGNTDETPRPLLIGGEFLPGRGTTPPLDSVNPATGRLNHRVATAGADEVNDAVAAATDAARAKAWRQMLPPQRAAILHRIGELMLRDSDRFARLQMLENGKVWAECTAQVKSAAATFRYYASVCETLGSELTPARGHYLSMTVHEPYGVMAATTP